MVKFDENFIKSVEENYPISKDKILDAYKFSAKAHEGLTRKSGEPYIVHPVAVAQILIDNNMDYPTIIAGLLHDVVEDTSVEISEIKSRYGDTVAALVEGVTKIDKITLETQNLTEAESIKKLLLAMAKDIRIIFIKLADRLHNMRTIEFLRREKQLKIAKETQELFIPIAERLGIRKIRSELQALTFKCLLPEDYFKIKNDLDAKINDYKAELDSLENEMKIILQHNRVQAQIVRLPENYFSIYKKINSQGTDKIYALKFFKIIVSTELDCYKVLGLLHRTYTPIPSQIKDYIATPKVNGYQSLHSALMSKGSGITFAVMIRTEQMDKNCEFGISSLWRNKDNDKKYEDKFEKHNDLKKIILGDYDEISSTDEFISAIKTDLMPSATWVFTREHKPLRINVKEPTAIDFAFTVHSDIGYAAEKAIVNGKEVPLSTVLKNGDEIEIVVSKTKKFPPRNWLAFAKTPYARRRIREFLRKNITEKSVEKGKKLLEKMLANLGKTASDIISNFGELGREFNFISLDDIYAAAALEPKMLEKIEAFFKEKTAQACEIKNAPVEIENCKNLESLDYAKCCMPVFGEKIVGVLSKNGVVVHCKHCKNLKNINGQNLVSAKWRAGAQKCLETSICVVFKDGIGMLSKIIDVLASQKIDITKMVATKKPAGLAEAVISFKIPNSNELGQLLKNLKSHQGIVSAAKNEN